MQSLKERLEALRAVQSFVESRWTKPGHAEDGHPAESESDPDGRWDGAGRAGERDAADSTPCDIAEVLDGEEEETPFGTCFHRRVYYTLDHRHGLFRLDEALGLAPETAGLLASPRQDSVDLRQAAFLDTETTGLAGGSGTYAFLIGVGHFAGDEFCLHQFFLRDYSDERAVLWALNQVMAPFPYLVTFCGRGFDWPLLETRYIVNRLRPVVGEPVHVDLIYPSRRLWKEKLGSCRLVNLEERILRVTREEDVPGAAIPGLYFRYLQERDARPLSGVLLHNERDIISLVTLACAIGRRLEDPERQCECPIELHSIGRLYERLGRPDEAVVCYRCAQAAGDDSLASAQVYTARSLGRLAFLLKKLQRFDEAETAFLQLVNQLTAAGGESLGPQGLTAVQAYVELAKHYEHRAADPGRALAMTERALDIALRHRRYASAGRFGQLTTDLERREKRLRRKYTGKY